MKGYCKCGTQFDETNCSPAILRNGHGNCRKCRNAYMRAYGAENREVIAKKNKVIYLKNIFRYRGYRRAYYANHKEEISAWHKKHIRTPKGRHGQVRETLKKDGVSLNDSLWRFNYYAEIIKDGLCHYCLGTLNPSSHALDRMNNDEPHACWNVVPCCWYCNEKKSNDTTYEEMMLLAPALREIRRRREVANVAATVCEVLPASF